MDKDYLIKLTLAVHQASEWWPGNVFLKFKIRNLVNEILADFILISHTNPGSDVCSRITKNIQALKQDLKELRAQKLIDRKDFLLFQREYNRIGEGVAALVPAQPRERIAAEKQESKVRDPVIGGLNQRQQKILQILERKEKIQVWELKKVFPNLSKRTLRRDLESLLKKELIRRNGQWNKVFYAPPLQG